MGVAGFVAASCVASQAQLQAQEEPKGMSPTYLACHGRARGSTVQDSLCAQAEIVSQDARLNKAYKRVMQQLADDAAGRQALQKAEQSWLKQRDYECQIDDHTIDSTCLVNKTAVRANELEAQLRF